MTPRAKKRVVKVAGPGTQRAIRAGCLCRLVKSFMGVDVKRNRRCPLHGANEFRDLSRWNQQEESK